MREFAFFRAELALGSKLTRGLFFLWIRPFVIWIDTLVRQGTFIAIRAYFLLLSPVVDNVAERILVEFELWIGKHL